MKTLSPRLLWSLVPLVSGALIFLNSGRAEGYVSFSSILIFPVLLCNLALIAFIVTFCWRAFQSAAVLTAAVMVFMGSVVVCDVLFFLAEHANEVAVEETKSRGDLLVEKIKKYRSVQKRWPASLKDVQAKLGELPTPVLKNGEFSYRRSEDGFLVHFAAPGFMVCSWSTGRPGWVCDD